MIPAGRGRERWTLSLHERTGEHVTDLVMLEGSGADDWDSSREVPHRLSCVLGQEPPPLRGRVLRGTYQCLGTSHQLGTWVPKAVVPRHTETGTTWVLTAFDPTVRLADAKLSRRVSWPAGTSVDPAVRQLVADHVQDVAILVDAASETLREPITLDAGSTVLAGANRLLVTAGLSPLRPDLHGRLLSRRLGSTASPVPALTWSDTGDGAKFLPELEMPEIDPQLPNEVIAIAAGGEANAGVVGYWSDPAAIAAYGRITEQIEIVATSQLAAHAQAREHGERPRRVAQQVSWGGPWQPVRGGQVVRLDWTRRRVSVLAELTQKVSQWSPGMPTTFTGQGVAS